MRLAWRCYWWKRRAEEAVPSCCRVRSKTVSGSSEALTSLFKPSDGRGVKVWVVWRQPRLHWSVSCDVSAEWFLAPRLRIHQLPNPLFRLRFAAVMAAQAPGSYCWAALKMGPYLREHVKMTTLSPLLKSPPTTQTFCLLLLDDWASLYRMMHVQKTIFTFICWWGNVSLLTSNLILMCMSGQDFLTSQLVLKWSSIQLTQAQCGKLKPDKGLLSDIDVSCTAVKVWNEKYLHIHRFWILFCVETRDQTQAEYSIHH